MPSAEYYHCNGKQKTKAHHSRAVSSVRWLEPSCCRPDDRSCYGFQGLDRLKPRSAALAARTTFSSRAKTARTKCSVQLDPLRSSSETDHPHSRSFFAALGSCTRHRSVSQTDLCDQYSRARHGVLLSPSDWKTNYGKSTRASRTGYDAYLRDCDRGPASETRPRVGTFVKQRYMLSVMCGRSTYKLTWEEIVRLYRLTLDQPARNTSRATAE